MSQLVDEAIFESEVLTDVKSEQVRIIYASTVPSLITILLCSLILSLVQWEVIDHTVIVSWFALTNLLSVARFYLYHQFKKLSAENLVSDGWYQGAINISIASGITWGAAGLLLFAEQSLVHQVFLAFVITGMCAGAITTLSAILNAARGFVVCALVPVIIKFYLINSDISLEMTIMSLLFMTMILLSAQRLNRIIRESLEVRLQRQLAEQTIRRQAQFDELTDLPNRRLFLSTLRREMASAGRHHRCGAVFFIDLDRFKSINDSLGHAVGDELLVKIARRIGERLRQEDTVGRLGGDEFVVLLPEVADDADSAGTQASAIADEIRKLFLTAFIIQGHEIYLTISVGIALFPTDESAEDLLKYADVAMYRAKSEGRNSVRLFSAEMQEAVNQQRIIEKGLRQALANHEFELYFQGQYDRDNHLVGAETLLRWNHPEAGVVAPGQFIDIAEQTGLIVPIGEWVLRSACKHLCAIDDHLMLAVNVSPRQLSAPDFVDQLEQILLETAANPRQLKFEITESLAMANIEHTIDTMNRLKQLGISFSVDDFGTGYSSLSYLNRLPLDELKIDQSFVRNISTASDHAIIVDTIIVMAQQLNLKTVAEGVESSAELEYLKSKNCQHFQGYYFSKPVPFSLFSRQVAEAGNET